VELKAVLLDHHPRPDAAQDLVLGNEFSARLDQDHQHFESPAAESDRHSVDQKFAAVR